MVELITQGLALYGFVTLAQSAWDLAAIVWRNQAPTEISYRPGNLLLIAVPAVTAYFSS